MRPEQIDELHYLAMRFWREVEAPSEESMRKLFDALIHSNKYMLKDLLKEHGK